MFCAMSGISSQFYFTHNAHSGLFFPRHAWKPFTSSRALNVKLRFFFFCCLHRTVSFPFFFFFGSLVFNLSDEWWVVTERVFFRLITLFAMLFAFCSYSNIGRVLTWKSVLARVLAAVGDLARAFIIVVIIIKTQQKRIISRVSECSACIAIKSHNGRNNVTGDWLRRKLTISPTVFVNYVFFFYF